MYEKIRQDINFAMKNGDKFKCNLLKCVMSDAQKHMKDNNGVIMEYQVVDIVKKYINNLKINRNVFKKEKPQSYEARINSCNCEIEILKQYLPEQLSEMEMITMISHLVLLQNNFSKIMMWFKDNHPNKYDGKFLSQLVKRIL